MATIITTTKSIGLLMTYPSIPPPKLKFSPVGNFLVSVSEANDEGLVKIWDYSDITNGYYLQLQEWNISQELDEDFALKGIDVSPCSRHVVVLLDRRVLLNDAKNNGKTIKSVLVGTVYEYGCQTIFSNIDGHHSIFIRTRDRHRRPHDVVDDSGPENTAPLITILEKSLKKLLKQILHSLMIIQ